MKSTCWDTRAMDSIIKSGQKDTEASILCLSSGLAKNNKLMSMFVLFSGFFGHVESILIKQWGQT